MRGNHAYGHIVDWDAFKPVHALRHDGYEEQAEFFGQILMEYLKPLIAAAHLASLVDVSY